MSLKWKNGRAVCGLFHFKITHELEVTNGKIGWKWEEEYNYWTDGEHHKTRALAQKAVDLFLRRQMRLMIEQLGEKP